jgi:serine/threonine-protein kinase
MYLAFEPYLRRYAPERVISWNRLLAGDWRDPLVGRDILFGIFAGMSVMILSSLTFLIPVWLGEPMPLPFSMSNPGGRMLSGFQGFPTLFLGQISASLVMGFMVSFLVLFFTLLLRRKLFGSIAAWLLLLAFAFSNNADSDFRLSTLAMILVFPTILIFTASRFGVLSVIAIITTYHLVVFYPITTELSAWYAGDFILCVIFLLALAVFGFYISLAGQPIFHARFLEERESL